MLDCSVEDVEYHRTEKCLPVGKVAVQSGDTDTGPLGNCVSGRLRADLEDELNRGVEKPPPVPSSVDAHRRARSAPCAITHETEYIPPFVGQGVTDDRRTPLRNHERLDATKSIAEAIAESSDTDYVAVTFESCSPVEGPFFHGTKTGFCLGEWLVPGQPSNYQAGRISNHVYFAALLEPAVWAAELAMAFAGKDERGHIYVVEPTGPFEDDPNVTNKKFPGNVTRSYRTRQPMRVIAQVKTWDEHAPEVVQGMLDNLARLHAQGLDVIDD